MNRYRIAKHEDIEKIVELVDSAYRGEISRQGWTTEADLLGGQRTDKAAVKSLIEQHNSQIILSEKDHQLMASVHLINKGDYAYLGMFAVAPTSQGQGLGKALLSYVESMVSHDWQSEFIEMTVITQRQELLQWYQNQGYTITGEIRDFPYGDERYGIPKRDDLRLDVLQKLLIK